VGLPILHDALKKLMAEGTLFNEDNTTPMEEHDVVLKWETPIEDWKDAHECKLLDAMLDFAGQYTMQGAKGGLQRARFWPLLVDEKKSYHLVLENAVKGKKTSPMLLVRQNSAGLPRRPERKEGQEAAIRGDLEEFQPSPVRGSFLLVD
jgi:hypothetical protein